MSNVLCNITRYYLNSNKYIVNRINLMCRQHGSNSDKTSDDITESNSSQNSSPKSNSDELITIYSKDKMFKGKIGQTLMSAAQEAGIPIEAACDGSLACSTCHVYIDENYFDTLPEPSVEEEDMLDLALYLKSNSRLSCQIKLSPELDGIKIDLPTATRNFYAPNKTET